MPSLGSAAPSVAQLGWTEPIKPRLDPSLRLPVPPFECVTRTKGMPSPALRRSTRVIQRLVKRRRCSAPIPMMRWWCCRRRKLQNRCSF